MARRPSPFSPPGRTKGATDPNSSSMRGARHFYTCCPLQRHYRSVIATLSSDEASIDLSGIGRLCHFRAEIHRIPPLVAEKQRRALGPWSCTVLHPPLHPLSLSFSPMRVHRVFWGAEGASSETVDGKKKRRERYIGHGGTIPPFLPVICLRPAITTDVVYIESLLPPSTRWTSISRPV